MVKCERRNGKITELAGIRGGRFELGGTCGHQDFARSFIWRRSDGWSTKRRDRKRYSYLSSSEQLLDRMAGNDGN